MPAPQRPLRIVVAEDDPDVCTFYRDALTRMGHEVVTVPDGHQLVRACKADPPDLVITDIKIKMQGLDGLRAVDAIQLDREVPVIVVSAFHGPRLLVRAFLAPVMVYLLKPVDQARLEQAIGEAMARFQQYQAARAEGADLRQALERTAGVTGPRPE